MFITFSQHALDQLKIRTRISRSMIIETIERPDNRAGSYRNRTLYQKNYNQEILEVVAIKEGDIITVITAYILSP